MPNKRIKTTGGSAVMENRVVGPVEGEDEQQAIYRKLDYFPTPPWAARAGAELIVGLDPACKIVREPACGAMHMAGPAGAYFEVWPSDVYPHSPNTPLKDWLDHDAWPTEPDCDWIMTNPPFALAEQFVTLGLKRARHGVALLTRLAFLETIGRYELMMGTETGVPLTLQAIFSERVPMTLGRWVPSAASATAYVWLFWMKDRDRLPPVWIAPGTRARLTYPQDAQTYGYKSPLPLFEGLEPARESRLSLGAGADLP
jgi:hypothetical protein